MSQDTSIYALRGVVQHYAWGGQEFIPHLLGTTNENDQPHAEYWIGTHSKGPAQIKVNGEWKSLATLTKLPYLLKILDVEAMLSIQSHPNKQQAEIGFNRENTAGIPLDAAHRVFRDDNHKPELMVALSDFWLLHGFRPLESINEWVQAMPAFRNAFTEEINDIKAFYTQIMRMSEAEQVAILSDLKQDLSQVDTADKDLPHYWASKAFDDYGMDLGIFSIYFFNLVHLNEGEAIYQEAGIPHAYLEGQNIEIMANSDNVFRAGLTPKHIDIDLLLAHLSFDPVVPKVISPQPSAKYELRYPSPATEFEIRIIDLAAGEFLKLKSFSSECYFMLRGQVQIESEADDLLIQKGESFYMSKAIQIQLTALTDTRLVRAITPSEPAEIQPI